MGRKKDEQVRPDELTFIHSVLTKLEADQIDFHHANVSATRLMELWEFGLAAPFDADLEIPTTSEPEEENLYEKVGVREERISYGRPIRKTSDPFDLLDKAEWFLGMSDEFVKAVQTIDRKLQGRILEAIGYIGSKPTEPKGDTIKPLTGELKGLWRYRIGDYRLVYWPDTQNRRVVLVDFTSRSGAYN